MSQNTRGGRKRSYSSDDLGKAVAIVEASCNEVNSQTIIAALKDELGLQTTPRKETLERELEAFLERRTEERNAVLVSQLPPVIREMVGGFVAGMEAQFLLASANAYRILTDENRKPLEAVQRYVALLENQNADLKRSVESQQEQIQTLQDQVAAKDAELRKKDDAIDGLNRQVEDLARNADLERMFEALIEKRISAFSKREAPAERP
ncbi:hypothetical protein [Rhodovulum adriaticum]|uniref:Plasmid replication DNA-binding protein KfrA n=1 Tax=Rhodovulum adriaticum TaxID=35804 RepID=A0A4R2NYS7_RHOAD|nr:hypothetical protein [Rhodovulum adriaticum]MBK1634159.1 hypothetical protein [Rhodovulum adriaticum]TCP27292.1 hypothetical protein EV656_101195 [Rhodovulum adriaticum]